MPVYDYRCRSCGKEYHNERRSIAERRTRAPECCDERTDIIIRPPREAFMQFFEPYMCPVTDQPVTTMRQRRDIMAEHNLVEQKQIKSGEW